MQVSFGAGSGPIDLRKNGNDCASGMTVAANSDAPSLQHSPAIVM
jgi:hypothetical protein